MTGIELLDFVYITGWVLWVLAVGGLFPMRCCWRRSPERKRIDHNFAKRRCCPCTAKMSKSGCPAMWD